MPEIKYEPRKCAFCGGKGRLKNNPSISFTREIYHGEHELSDYTTETKPLYGNDAKCPVCSGTGSVLACIPERRCAACGGTGKGEQKYGVCVKCCGKGKRNQKNVVSYKHLTILGYRMREVTNYILASCPDCEGKGFDKTSVYYQLCDSCHGTGWFCG